MLEQAGLCRVRALDSVERLINLFSECLFAEPVQRAEFLGLFLAPERVSGLLFLFSSFQHFSAPVCVV